MQRTLALFVVVASCAFSQTLTPAREAAIKSDLTGQIDGMKKQAQVMVDTVFSYGELGFQEFETSKYLSDTLEKNGFKVERGVAGIPTAFMATWGEGKPVIALGSDIDDIPQASQKPGVAYHDPIIEGAPGHGEGHNSGMPLNILAALAVKQVMEREHIKGTIKLWPGVAEELLGTKAYYVKAGLFKDVDVVLFCHVANNFGVSYGPGGGDGMVSVEYSFKGESAHSARSTRWNLWTLATTSGVNICAWLRASITLLPTAAISPTLYLRMPPFGITSAKPTTTTS
jgi:aminobenzoyl-glutamate utilization protein B